MAKADDKTPETGLAVNPTMAELPAYDPNVDTWETLTSGDTIIGSDLAKDELLDALVGVPFVITRLVFRKGILRSNGVQGAYVSCEAVIAPKDVLVKRRVDLNTLPFDPGASVVFNDGSTGMYRQILGYLVARGMVEVPDTLPEAGSYGETRYDIPPNGWSAVNAGEVQFEPDGWANYSVNIRLACPRGIRLSEYENDFNPNGSKTRYFG